MKSKVLNKKNNLFSQVLKGTLASISCSLVLILIFALIIRFFGVGDAWIFPINQIIKVISLFLGINLTITKDSQKGFLTGILLGVFYFVLSFIIFSILQGKVNFGWNNLIDMFLTMIMSGIIGAILVNLKK